MNKERLLKLAEHLESGKLGHKKFNFSVYNCKMNYNDSPFECGYTGCAIGELPIIFSDEWSFSDNGMPNLIVDSSDYVSDDAMEFFDITLEQFSHLFSPDNQMPERFGGKHLSDNATRYDVADGIRSFIEALS